MEFKIFKNFPELIYGISERKNGDMEPMGISGRDSVARQKRQRFFNQRNIKGRIFSPYLEHGDRVVVVSEKNFKDGIKADGFITKIPNLFLTITVADCFPLYFYDPVKQVIGLVHGGWRGVAKNITKNVASQFIKSFHSDPQDIILAIGPGLQKCHFVVQDDVVGKFNNCPKFIEKRDGGYEIDLPGIIISQANKCGVVTIESSGLCTFCLRDRYFSYRRDKPKTLEVMIAYIGLRED